MPLARLRALRARAQHVCIMTKILTPLLLAAFALGGCVAYEPSPPPRPHYGYSDRDRDGVPDRHRDRDHDRVPDRYDRAPNNPYYR